MSLDPPTYLASLQNNLRQRPIAWEGAVRTGTLTEDQLAKIRAVDKVKKDVRKEKVEADLDGYRILFVGEPGNPSVLELASRRQEIVQYILVLLNDLLESMSCSFPFDASQLPLETPRLSNIHQPSPHYPKLSSRAATPIGTSYPS